MIIVVSQGGGLELGLRFCFRPKFSGQRVTNKNDVIQPTTNPALHYQVFIANKIKLTKKRKFFERECG